MNGIIKSCEKRPVSINDIEQIVDDIEKTLSNSLEKEITSVQIGEMVMDKLKDLDEVAYVRFASVYRQFKDVNSFMTELKNYWMRVVRPENKVIIWICLPWEWKKI